MTFSWRVIASGAVGYGLGMIPSAVLATRLASDGEIDITRQGSGNPGGANVAAVVGVGAGSVVMVSDIAKGALAARLGRGLAGGLGANIAASAAVLGHCYPAIGGFHGGKGVATSVGQCLATFPIYAPIDFAIAAATAGASTPTGRAEQATAVASLCWVAAAALVGETWWPNLWGPKPDASLPVAAAVTSAAILQRFRAERSGANSMGDTQ